METVERRQVQLIRPVAWHADPLRSPVRGGRDRRWLERAARVAEGASGRWRLGCILVSGGRVLASAVNTVRNDPAVLDDQPWLSSEHAEMAALRMAGHVRGATLYVARIGSDGTTRHAQPCVRCQAQLEARSIRAVWSSDEEYILGVARFQLEHGRETAALSA